MHKDPEAVAEETEDVEIGVVRDLDEEEGVGEGEEEEEDDGEEEKGTEE